MMHQRADKGDSGRSGTKVVYTCCLDNQSRNIFAMYAELINKVAVPFAEHVNLINQL
jgi:hypothetical protein